MANHHHATALSLSPPIISRSAVTDLPKTHLSMNDSTISARSGNHRYHITPRAYGMTDSAMIFDFAGPESKKQNRVIEGISFVRHVEREAGPIQARGGGLPAGLN